MLRKISIFFKKFKFEISKFLQASFVRTVTGRYGGELYLSTKYGICLLYGLSEYAFHERTTTIDGRLRHGNEYVIKML